MCRGIADGIIPPSPPPTATAATNGSSSSSGGGGCSYHQSLADGIILPPFSAYNCSNGYRSSRDGSQQEVPNSTFLARTDDNSQQPSSQVTVIFQF